MSLQMTQFCSFLWLSNNSTVGFPGGSDGKASACNAEDPGSIPGSGRSPGKRNGTQSSTLAWKMYCIFFIHSFVNGPLDCFHVFAIGSSASMNIGV